MEFVDCETGELMAALSRDSYGNYIATFADDGQVIDMVCRTEKEAMKHIRSALERIERQFYI